MPDPPGGLVHRLGARVEVPGTRAIVSHFRFADYDEDSGEWTVRLLGVPLPGLYNFVWLTNDPPPFDYRPPSPEFEEFIPLDVRLGVGDGDGLFPALGFNYPEVDEDAVRPTVEEVSRLLRTRTFDSLTAEHPVFTNSTRPTDWEVEEIIEHALEVVLSSLPARFNPDFYRATSRVIALYTAMTIEASYFREQQTPAGAPVRWETEYHSARDRLQESIEGDRKQNNLLGAMEPRVQNGGQLLA